MEAKMITVIGKDNLGQSWKFGEIVKDQEYRIAEDDFTDQLFVKPSPQTLVGKD